MFYRSLFVLLVIVLSVLTSCLLWRHRWIDECGFTQSW